jgi:hypothetical protein
MVVVVFVPTICTQEGRDMKVAAILGIQPTIALDTRHPDQQAKEPPNPKKHDAESEPGEEVLDQEGMHQLPLATSGALGTRLNVVV